MELKEIVKQRVITKYGYNGSRIESPFNHKIYVSGITRLGSNGETYLPLSLLKDNKEISNQKIWINIMELYKKNYILLTPSYKIRIYEQLGKDNTYNTFMRIYCYGSKYSIIYNLTESTILLYYIIHKVKMGHDVTPELLYQDLFVLKDIKRVIRTEYNDKNTVITYSKEIYDDISFSYSVKEALKEWWNIYKDTEIKNLMNLYNKFKFTEIFGESKEEDLQEDLFNSFINSFRNIYDYSHNPGRFVKYYDEDFTSLDIRNDDRILHIDMGEYLNINKFRWYKADKVIPSNAYNDDSINEFLTMSANNLLDKNGINFQDKITEEDKNYKYISDMRNLIEDYVRLYGKLNKHISTYIPLSDFTITFGLDKEMKWDAMMADHIGKILLYKSNSPALNDIFKDGQTIVFFVSERAPLYFRIRYDDIETTEPNDYFNCINIVDVLQMAIDDEVINKDELDSVYKNMLNI